MSDETRPAFVLEEGAVAHTEPVHFANFPGVWAEGRPVALAELDGSDDDLRARAEELGLPLVETTVAADEGLLPVDPSRAPGADEVVGTDWTPPPGTPGARLEPGEVFPPAAPVSDDQLAEEVAPALEPNAAEVIAAVESVDDVETLEAMSRAERDGKQRKTVLEAIDARVAVLTDERTEG